MAVSNENLSSFTTSLAGATFGGLARSVVPKVADARGVRLHAPAQDGAARDTLPDSNRGDFKRPSSSRSCSTISKDVDSWPNALTAACLTGELDDHAGDELGKITSIREKPGLAPCWMTMVFEGDCLAPGPSTLGWSGGEQALDDKAMADGRWAGGDAAARAGGGSARLSRSGVCTSFDWPPLFPSGGIDAALRASCPAAGARNRFASSMNTLCGG